MALSEVRTFLRANTSEDFIIDEDESKYDFSYHTLF